MTAMRTKQHRATARRKAGQRALIAQARAIGLKRVLDMQAHAVWQHPDTAWRLIRTFVEQEQARLRAVIAEVRRAAPRFTLAQGVAARPGGA